MAGADNPGMIQPLEFKPDLPRTLERFEAWWHGEVLDRPPVTLAVKPVRPFAGPESRHASLRERWLDVEFNVEAAIARLKRCDCVGDALPCYMPDIGPELTATLLGATLEFGEHTSWSVPCIHEMDHWRQVAVRPLDFANPYWQAVEDMTRLALDKCHGRCLVGIADLHGNMDILAALREPQALCMDLLDDPGLVVAALDRAVEAFVIGFERLWGLVNGAGQPSCTWIPMLHDGPAYVVSSDFWCMISDELARDLVLPAIVREMRPLERCVFHLDGPLALRHLDLLLQLPRLDAVQWVFGAGQGPASRWIEVYRRCVAADKSVQVLAQTPDDALAVLDAVGPRGLWLCIDEPLASVDEAQAFLGEVVRRGVKV